MSKQATLPEMDENNSESNENSEKPSEKLGFTPSERQDHLNQICNDVEDIEGVEEANWIAKPKYYDDAQLNITLESEKIPFRSTYKIEKNLRTLNTEIKEVLQNYNDKQGMNQFRPPNWKDTNKYDSNLYEVKLMMV